MNKLLVGNKSDLEAKRAVTTEEAKVRKEKSTNQIHSRGFDARRMLKYRRVLCTVWYGMVRSKRNEIGGISLSSSDARYGTPPFQPNTTSLCVVGKVGTSLNTYDASYFHAPIIVAAAAAAAVRQQRFRLSVIFVLTLRTQLFLQLGFVLTCLVLSCLVNFNRRSRTPSGSSSWRPRPRTPPTSRRPS